MKKLLFILFVFHSIWLQAQPVSLRGQVNQYAAVTGINVCQNWMEVDNPQYFPVGQNVLIWQVKGADLKTNQLADYGSINGYGSCGYFEVQKVRTVVGSRLYFNYAFKHTYDVNGRVQVVTMPHYNTASVDSSVKAANWNGQTGGIVAIWADSLILNDSISVAGQGFRGGYKKSKPQSYCYNLGTGGFQPYSCDSASNNGAPKGEGIGEVAEAYGRGPQGNGGGGGNDHNTGGAGGGNAGAGGNGGQRTFTSAFNCPGPNPGIGGYLLNHSVVENRLFMGGGGGAGDANNNEGTGGTNGGGAVFILSDNIVSNNKVINANGLDQNIIAGSDGAGAGGAGGTVMLSANAVSGNLAIYARGGNGGKLNNQNLNYCMGPGGGGGGGAVWLSFPSLQANIPLNVGFGVNGTNISNVAACPNGTTNGAAAGEIGSAIFNWAPLIASDSFIALQTFHSNDTSICLGQSVTLLGGGISTFGPQITWSNGSNQPQISLTPPQTITASVEIKDHNNCAEVYFIKVNVFNPSSTAIANPDTLYFGLGESQLTCDSAAGWKFTWSPADGLSSANVANPIASPSQTTVYCVTASDNIGCSSSACVSIVVLPSEITVPNAFTPNGDGHNDLFKVIGLPELILRMRIFNRWGELIFDAKDNNGWDGNYQGKEQPAGNYLYSITIGTLQNQSRKREVAGEISLIR